MDIWKFLQVDNSWILNPEVVCAPQGTLGFSQRESLLLNKLEQLYQETANAPFANENMKTAVKKLHSYGLQISNRRSSLESEILSMLSDNNHQYNLLSPIGEPIRIIEPHLLLYAITAHTNIKVYLFSSRSKTRVFGDGDIVIGLLHMISSYTGESEFFSLKPNGSDIKKFQPKKASEQRPLTSVARIVNPGASVKRTTHSKIIGFDDALDAIYESFQNTLTGIVTKDVKDGRHKEEIKDDLRAATRCPRGVIPQATTMASNRHGKIITDDDIRRALGYKFEYGNKWSAFATGKRYLYQMLPTNWRHTEMAGTTIANVEEQISAEESADAGDDDSTASEHDDESTSNVKKKKIRTCSAPLRSILRDDLGDDGRLLFESLVDKSARKLTDDMSEISALSHCVILEMASHGFQPSSSGFEVCDNPADNGFKLSNIFPQQFAFRDRSVVDEQGLVPVQPLCQGLQGHLESLGEKRRKDDIYDLFGQNHLQFLKSFHLTRNCRSSSLHPVWTDLSKRITWDHPSMNTELSQTSFHAIRQLSANLNTMWSERRFQKALEYVCRVLLRVRLAPTREQNYINIRNKFKARKLSDKDDNNKKFNNKWWKRSMKKDMKNLAIALTRISNVPCREQDRSRIFINLQRIFSLQDKKNNWEHRRMTSEDSPVSANDISKLILCSG